MPRVSAAPFAPSTVLLAAGSRCAFALSSVLCAAGSVVLGRQERGSGGKPGTGRLGALGGFRVSPSAFPDWSPLLPVYSRSRAVVFPTSPSCSMRGEHGGGAERARQRRQEGGPRRKRSAQRPHLRALCCTASVRAACEACAGRSACRRGSCRFLDRGRRYSPLPREPGSCSRLRARVTLPRESAAICQAPRLLPVRSLSSTAPFPP